MTAWDFDGEIKATMDDHLLWAPDSSQNIFITSQQDLIVSYCRPSQHADNDDRASGSSGGAGGVDSGSIHVSCIADGKCLAKLTGSTPERALALEKVTALHYNEDCNEIYTGNANGLVHVWAN